ncbi:receptor activity-modifying protein 2 isoform X3 [Patagioenas fasciata]|uniref:receptor activity-modifying protein 2 isoform X3 n=1 Tax=Patagioenas fasciata TaxID=372321 RepID=UPI003A99B59D
MAPCAQTGSGRLSRGLLLLCALLGTGLCHVGAEAESFGQDARTSPPVAVNWTAQLVEEMYTNITQKCWEFFVDLMRNVTVSELCEWKVISSHRRYFHNCTLQHQVFDPPQDVLLPMIIAPICLIPFLVTLVIWRSKDGKAQA